MKTDLYTKSVLTIIAACLLSIAFRDVPLVSTAHAQSPQGPLDVNIAEIGGSGGKVRVPGALLVRVQN
jgi:hypothetical protein